MKTRGRRKTKRESQVTHILIAVLGGDICYMHVRLLSKLLLARMAVIGLPARASCFVKECYGENSIISAVISVECLLLAIAYNNIAQYTWYL